MEAILNKQKEFQKLLKQDVESIDFQRLMFLGMYEELGEAGKETRLKAHKKHQDFDKENFTKELADVQIYLINLLLSADMSWEKFQKIVEEKVATNFERQKNDY